jgi:hypothetical protein
MKKTPWFDARKYKPIRVGTYEFYDSLWNSTWFIYWDGKRWPWTGNGTGELYKGDKWRGLTEKAK